MCCCPLCFRNRHISLLQRSNIRISAVLDLSPFPVLGLHVLASCAASLMCVVSSLEDELAIKKVAELSGISMTQLQCVTEKQLLDVLDSGKVFFDVIVAHLVDPSGELKETAFNMIPALRYECIQLSCINVLLMQCLEAVTPQSVT